MENTLIEMQFALDTFYFLVMGALVMWMAAGSGIVHMAGAAAALAGVLALGARKGKYDAQGNSRATPDANMPVVTFRDVYFVDGLVWV